MKEVEPVRYGIIVNPAAGRESLGKKRKTIDRCAEILGPDTVITGWDTRSAEELRRQARELARRVDVVVVAGGDGTLSDIMNSIDSGTVLSYLPLGSGNAWRHTLGLPTSRRKAAQQIRNGRVHALDLILVDNRLKGVFASVGFEGHALNEREKLLNKGVSGFDAYFRATAKALLGGYKGEDATVYVNEQQVKVRSAISLIVTKTPFYGYGLRVVPKAKLDDGLLHVLLVSGQPITTLSSIVTSLLGGNLFGQHVTCKTVAIRTEKELHLQVDGDLVRKGTYFSLRVLPSALRMRY